MTALFMTKFLTGIRVCSRTWGKNFYLLRIRDEEQNTDINKIKFSLCLTNQTPCHQYALGRAGGHTAPPFLASEADGGEWLGSRPGPFTAKEEPPVLTGQEDGWAPEPVWTLCR